MADPYIGEIRLFPINFAPKGWAFCEGQTLSIAQNQALFSLLGTTYGGNGTTTFALPDLRGRVPIHFSSTFPLGQSSGEANHTLTVSELPAHNHMVNASTNNASAATPSGNVWASQLNLYGPASTLTTMNTGTISSAGGSQAHANMQPYLAVNFAIALQGIYPTRS